MLRRWICALIGHDLHMADTVVSHGVVHRTKCRRCPYVLQTPEV
jgi:hypothetical protein